MLVVAATVCAAACRADALNIFGQEGYVWEPRGAWSGRGSRQTESFEGKTGGLRLTWMTRPASGEGAGTFGVSVHNAQDGRKIVDAIDQRWADRGTAFLFPGPQTFYLVIDSADADWTVTVEETVPSH